VVLTTHAMDEAEQLCDRLAIIDHGRLVACDTPKELTTLAAADETTFSTVAGLPVDALATRLALDAGRVRELRPGDYLVERAATPDMLAAITAWLAEQGALLTQLRAGRRSLEDVFLRLTGDGRS
jgi:ABC-2 type transport system ATP-binding protein